MHYQHGIILEAEVFIQNRRCRTAKNKGTTDGFGNRLQQNSRLGDNGRPCEQGHGK